MSNDHIEELLQKCLEGYDAGLTPEECLSAYPHARKQLEPLLRQALSLRVAYAAIPGEAFRQQARERLLFAAGRDVGEALTAEPSHEFVTQTRQKLLSSAGAGAQEALRDVPPPRLPFWSNARRRLLEAAAASATRPARHPAFATRSALSAAVIVLAVLVAGLGFVLQSNPLDNSEPSASLAFADLEQGVIRFEEAVARGEAVNTEVLLGLVENVSNLTDQLADERDADVIQKLPGLNDRLRNAADQLLTPNAQPELAADLQSQLSENDEKLRQAVSQVESPTPEATSEPSTALTAPTEEPTATPAATATLIPQELIEPQDLGPDEIAAQPDLTDTTHGIRWTRITTSNITFVIDSTWITSGIQVNDEDIAVYDSDVLFIQTPYQEQVPFFVLRTTSGEVTASINGESVSLRGEGQNANALSPVELRELFGGELGPVPAIEHFLSSIEVVE